MKKIIGLSAVCIMCMTATVGAAPSINGGTGLITTPTADVLSEGQVSVGHYWLHQGNSTSADFNVSENVEVGLTNFRSNGKSDKTYVNAKFSVSPETIVTPGIALGVIDASNDSDRTFYGTISKGLPLGFRVHVGLGDGLYKNRVFGGIEKTISPLGMLTGDSVFPATTLIAEYDGDKMNFGARVAIVPGLKADAGWRERDKRTYLGVSFTNL